MGAIQPLLIAQESGRMRLMHEPIDAPQLFKQVVRYYYIAGGPFTSDNIVHSHSMYPNNYITSNMFLIFTNYL